MKAGRRELLQVGALAGAGALLSGCSRIVAELTAPRLPESIALPQGELDPLARLVNRVSFGPTPNELARVASIGREAYVEEQLAAEGAEPVNLQLRLRGNDAISRRPNELRDLKQTAVIGQLSQAALLMAVYSPFQLRERMADFWTNHFSISARKGIGPYLKPYDEVHVIRKHALGKFPDLLRASAKSAAMLCYLDNHLNRHGERGANENYARELMELHTLGVGGGYSQRDVMEVARCFTGWTIENRFLEPPRFLYPRGAFRFDESAHDNGPKRVLGHLIPAGGGVKDGERVLEILANHPSTARFIARKLVRYFFGTDSPEWTERLAAIYARTGGDIRAMIRPLLLSDDLTSAPPILKRPFDFIASALRALAADTDGGPGLQAHLDAMGQPLYQWPMPDGYPDETAAWTGSLLARWNFAIALTANRIPGVKVNVPALMEAAGATLDPEAARAIVELTFGRSANSQGLKPVTERLEQFVRTAPRAESSLQQATALALASPAFQWR